VKSEKLNLYLQCRLLLKPFLGHRKLRWEASEFRFAKSCRMLGQVDDDVTA